MPVALFSHGNERPDNCGMPTALCKAVIGMRYLIESDPSNWAKTGGSFNGPALRIWDVGRTESHLVRVTVSRSLASVAGLTEDEALSPPLLELALRRARQVAEDGIPDVVAPEDAVSLVALTMDSPEAEELERITTLGRVCEWQVDEGRNQFCIAASADDETAHWEIGGSSAAPTSAQICSQCAVPHGALLCDRFSHPSVSGQLFVGGRDRSFMEAICQAGSLKIRQPGGCIPSGHDCWVQEVAIAPAKTTESPGPLALLEALDHLDATWRVRNGGKNRLLQLRSAYDTGVLATNVTNREQFKDRITALADVVDQISVPDGLLPEPAEDEKLPRGSLDRLVSWANSELEGDDLNDSLEALGRLRFLRQLRTPFAHSSTQDKLPKRLAALGISYPPDWATAWLQVRAWAIDALRTLRRSISD